MQIGTITKISLPAFTPVAASTAAGTIRLRTCLVNVQRAAIKVSAVYGSNRFLTLSIVWHLNEAKATRLACVTIRADVDTTDTAVGFEQRTDRFFRSPKTEGSNVNVLGYSSFAGLQAVNLAGGRR